MTLKIKIPESVTLKPKITVFGVGGAGGNAVNNMISANLGGVKFVAANTDAQALENSKAEHTIQLGSATTKGLGAGALPEIGAASAHESLDEVNEHLHESNMVFITAGMGGGTGTGAAPIIAKAAKDKNILTIGVVTKPFHFEGAHRMRLAERGIEELEKYVDTLIVIPNQNLFRVANEKTTFADAFLLADNVLHSGVRGITDLMIMPGLINLDFADIKTVMSEMGKAMMGTGEADGEGRAVRAAEAAISNPLLAHSSMKGAKGVLINITGGSDMTLYEVDEAANRIRDEIENENANIIFGSTFNPDMTGKMRVSVVSTGIDQKDRPAYVPVSSIIVEEISSLEEQEESSELQSEFSLNDQNNINQENLDDVVIFESNNNNQSQGQSSFNFDFPDDAEASYQTAVNSSLKERQPDAKSRFSLRNLFSKFTSSNPQENLNSNLVNNGQTENPSFSQDDDYSDVPAFIRRKK